MRNRQTVDELGQEFAALKQAHDLAYTEATQALEQHQVAAINPRLLVRTYDGHVTNETASALLHAYVVANDKRLETERAMNKVSKQAWKWYRVAL